MMMTTSDMRPGTAFPIQSGTMAGGGASLAPTDIAPPALASHPVDGQAANADLLFTFDEQVQAGNGTLTLRATDGQSIYSTSVAGSSAITVAGKTMTLHLAAPLAYATSYTVELDGGAVKDLAGNDLGRSSLVFRSGLSPVAVNTTGTGQADKIDGSDLDDFLDGDAGNDFLAGHSGHDRIIGGAGDDTLDGGAGNDTLSDTEGSNLLLGGDGDDWISAWQAGDLILSQGRSTLDGGAGNDTLITGSGDAVVLGGSGNDRIEIIGTAVRHQPNTVIVDGGAGDDTITLNPGYSSSLPGTATVTGGEGSDTYRLLGGHALLTITDFQAGAGGDVLDLTFMLPRDLASNPFGKAGYLKLVQDGTNTLLQYDADGAAGGTGFGTIATLEHVVANTLTRDNFTQGFQPDGVALAVILQGSAGADTLRGGLLADTLHGGDGNDVLYGADGNDILYGDGGDDSLDGGNGDDSLDGGDGNDVLTDSSGNGTLDGGDGDDSLAVFGGTHVLLGGRGNDHLSATGPGGNLLSGGEGNDVFYSSASGPDTLDGGAGNDDLLFVASNFASPDPRTAPQIVIDGGSGDDFIHVSIYGAAAFDIVIRGGTGSDTFDVLNTSPNSKLSIVDFQAGTGGDVLDLSLLAPWQGKNPFVGGALQAQQRGADTVIRYHPDGAGPDGFQDIVTLRDVDMKTLGAANFMYGINPDGSDTGILLAGTDAADWLSGKLLNDTLMGGAGNDILYGSLGNDVLDGGDGDDFLDGDRIPDPMYGSETGNPGRDDWLRGGAGNDVLVSSAGNDTLEGGAGNDTIRIVGHSMDKSMPADNISASGGSGDDLLLVDLAADNRNKIALSGGAGDDTFRIHASADPQLISVSGGPGRDVFEAGSSYSIDDFQAGAGGDRIELAKLLAQASSTRDPFGAGQVLRLLQSGTDTLLQFDQDGSDAGHDYATVLTLRNVTVSTLTADNFVETVDLHAAPVALPSPAPTPTPTPTPTPDPAPAPAPTPPPAPAPAPSPAPAAPSPVAPATPGQTYSGGAGDDVLTGGAGNDLLVGGSGLDTAVYGGARTGYAVSRDAAGWHVADQSGLEGTDTLLDVERLQFSDGALALDTDGVAGQAYRMYRAAFDRAPDLGGLGFWIGAMDKGASLRQVAEGFAGSQEFAKLYGAPTNADVVGLLYKNVLHRAPDEGGFAFWLDALERKVTDLPGLLASFSESPENQAAVAELVGGGIAFTPYGG